MDQNFLQSFAAAREETVNKLLAAIGEHENAVCAPIDSSFMFGWVSEARDSEASQMQGGASYGAAYLRHMIDQGLRTAFAVLADSKPIMICLKTWEPGEPEPDWPHGRRWSEVHYHQSPRPAPRA